MRARATESPRARRWASSPSTPTLAARARPRGSASDAASSAAGAFGGQRPHDGAAAVRERQERERAAGAEALPGGLAMRQRAPHVRLTIAVCSLSCGLPPPADRASHAATTRCRRRRQWRALRRAAVGGVAVTPRRARRAPVMPPPIVELGVHGATVTTSASSVRSGLSSTMCPRSGSPMSAASKSSATAWTSVPSHVHAPVRARARRRAARRAPRAAAATRATAHRDANRCPRRASAAAAAPRSPARAAGPRSRWRAAPPGQPTVPAPATRHGGCALSLGTRAIARRRPRATAAAVRRGPSSGASTRAPGTSRTP